MPTNTATMLHSLRAAGKLHTWDLYVQRVYRLTSCEEKLAEEARGMIGWHRYTDCPKCQRVFQGWEFWGSNGHMQGSAPTRDRLLHSLARFAQNTIPVPDMFGRGHVLGWRIRNGSDIYYRS